MLAPVATHMSSLVAVQSQLMAVKCRSVARLRWPHRRSDNMTTVLMCPVCADISCHKMVHDCVQVADFGLSRQASSSTVDTDTYGTVTHMPPELLMEGKLTKSADVYAFGVLLWEMYTGALSCLYKCCPCAAAH